MNDNDQKRQMERAWDSLPLGRATKAIWVVLKHGTPAGADGRDITVSVCDAEKSGLQGFGNNVASIAPANQYVKIPGMNGESTKFRFSRDFVAVVANSYSAHLARMVEANIRVSNIPLDTALGVTLRSAKDLAEKNPGLGRKELAQYTVMNGSYQLLVNALRHSPEYQEDLAASKVSKDDIRVLRCAAGRNPEVVVSTVSGGQKSYSLSMEDESLTVLHGEMSGLISDSPLAPSLDFPLLSASYTVIFLRERGEAKIDVQWEPELTPADNWSDKLMFR
jgi:hypothetical protein